MGTSLMTSEEKAWIRNMQKLLDATPARFGFYTIGDPSLEIYDCTKDKKIEATYDSSGQDFGHAVSDHNANLASLRFKRNVHSTAG